MEIKKNSNPSKIPVKRKEIEPKPTEPIKPTDQSKPEPKQGKIDPKQSKVDPKQSKVDPNNIPKVKVETTNKSTSHFETIKQKRDQMFQQEKIRQKQIRENAIVARKHMRISQISLAITLVLLIVFAPIYPNKNFKILDRDYLLMADIDIEHNLGDYISPFQYYRYKHEVSTGSEYIQKVGMHYYLREMRVIVNIKEYKPLVKDAENNIYFYVDSKVVKKSDLDLYAPVISGFDQKTLEELLKSMQSLDYDVIQQIDTIEYVGNEDDPDLLKMGMDGDNTVYIDIDQIKHKLPYYNQMKQIIDEKADGKPGIIHLDIGDYYEPK